MEEEEEDEFETTQGDDIDAIMSVPTLQAPGSHRQGAGRAENDPTRPTSAVEVPAGELEAWTRRQVQVCTENCPRPV